MSDSVSHIALKKLNSQHFLDLGGLLDWGNLSDTEQGLREARKHPDHTRLSSEALGERKGKEKGTEMHRVSHGLSPEKQQPRSG